MEGERLDPEQARLVVDEASLLDVVATLREEEQYGIDTEFHRERTYYPHLALLQLSWRTGIALVDPLAVDVAPLQEVLKGPGTAIVHASDQDLQILERACGAVPATLFDTQIAAGFIGFSSASLGSLTERLLGVHLEKGDQLTDWTRRPLTAEQSFYAANDVAFLLQLHDELVRRLEQKGRLEWALAECALALEHTRSSAVPEEAWWKLRQARQLRGRSRGVAQELAAWRERRAQHLDVPVRSVFPDLAIVSMAQRPPKSAHDLERVRSIDSRHLANAVATELLAAVSAGLSLSERSLVLPPGIAGEAAAKPAVALASAWAQERARQLEIDPAIFATRADVVAYLRDQPQGRLLDSWRHDLVGDPIRRLVAGEVSVALEDNSLVLEERSHRPITDGAPDLG